MSFFFNGLLSGVTNGSHYFSFSYISLTEFFGLRAEIAFSTHPTLPCFLDVLRLVRYFRA